MALNIRAFLGKLMKALKRLSFKDSLNAESVRSIGGKYWKKIPVSSKSAYLSSQQGVVKDDPKADYHVGSPTFQNVMIGGSVLFLNLLGQIMSERWLKSEIVDYPNGLNKNVEKTTSAYFYEMLIQSLSLYQKNDEIEKSRSRRYDMKILDDGTKEYLPRPIPWHPFVKKMAFIYYDEIWKGIRILSQMTRKQQHIMLREHIISHVNSGYPTFTEQTKDNFGKLWAQTVRILGINLIIDEEEKKENIHYITVDEVLNVIKHCVVKKLYFPFLLWYRIQKQTHRSVFGAFYILKMMGALFSAAKDLTFKDDHIDSNLDDIFEKRLFGIGGLPFIAQVNWTQLFTAILARCPEEDDSGRITPMTADKINELFGAQVTGDHKVNVIGEDLEKYDTSLIGEDLEELRKHKNMGWILGYLIDVLYKSEVWTAFTRVFDVQFKSGHPETSNFGSFPHLNLVYLTRDRLKRKYPKGIFIVLAVSVLSDDDIIFVIGITAKDIAETADLYGLVVKINESFDYHRDHYVGFLKVEIGYNVKGVKAFHGDPFSRYYGLCHSERKINDEEPEKNELRAIWKITGKVTIDAIISKLASFGKYDKRQVLFILEIMKDTTEGREVIMAISQIDPDAKYELYRRDVPLGFEPNWLASLEVLSILQ